MELPKSHWTSPLGPFSGRGGLSFLHGAKHSLPGCFSAKSGVKTCKVTDLHESVGILHFKARRIQVHQRFCHPSRFWGVVVKIKVVDEHLHFLMVFTVCREESERTGGHRFAVRNLHVRIYLPSFRLLSDLLRARVAGGWRSAILVAILEFLKSRKISTRS